MCIHARTGAVQPVKAEMLCGLSVERGCVVGAALHSSQLGHGSRLNLRHVWGLKGSNQGDWGAIQLVAGSAVSSACLGRFRDMLRAAPPDILRGALLVRYFSLATVCANSWSCVD